MKMKKISKLISLSVIMCLLISSLCVLNVSADTGDLLFDMNLSEFQKGNAGESWGITNNGSSSTATIKLNDGVTTDGVSTGTITQETYTNVAGETFPYLNFNQIQKEGNCNGPDANNRIWIEDAAWANQMLTAEVWLKAEPTSATADELLRLYGEDDDDRSSLDRVINLDINTEGSWMIDSTTSTDVAAGVSATNASNGKWVHVAITRGLTSTNTGGSDNIYLYVNGTRINTNGRGLKAVDETVAGLLLGTYRTLSTDRAPHNFGVASVKIYQGKLSGETIKAHYNAEAGNFTPLLCEETVYAADESFTVELSDITDDVPDTEQGMLTLGGEEIEAEFSYDEETKKISVTPCDYLLDGNYYVLSFGDSLSGAIRVKVKTSTIEVEDVSYSGGAIDYTITGDGTPREVMVLAVGYDVKGELLTGAVYGRYTLSGTEAEPKKLEAPKLVDANSIKFMVWEICDGYTRPLADIIEIE